MYPGTGSAVETGRGPGEGYTLNLPLPAGTRGGVYQQLITEKVIPAMQAFNPELILISAGFDAHEGGPLAGVLLKDEDFAMMSRQVLEAADQFCGGKVVAVLEGGYDLARMSHKFSTALRNVGTGAGIVRCAILQGVDPAAPAHQLETRTSTRSSFARYELAGCRLRSVHAICGLGELPRKRSRKF